MFLYIFGIVKLVLLKQNFTLENFINTGPRSLTQNPWGQMFQNLEFFGLQKGTQVGMLNEYCITLPRVWGDTS